MTDVSGWPPPGPVDLSVHDLPHADAPTEWWYVNAHLTTEEGRELALFASFFRIVTRVVDNQPVYAHSLTWALADPSTERYLPDSRIDADAPRLGLEKLERHEGTSDPRLRRAIRELLERDQVPYPDRLLDGEVHVARDRLDLDYAGARFTKQKPGRYLLAIPAGEHHPGCELTFELTKDPVRHGEDGIVQGVDGGDMFYYFIPRCAVTGTVDLDGDTHAVTGDGWYDHEFGQHREGTDERPSRDAAWTWLAIQLEGGVEVTAYDMLQPSTGNSLGKRALIIEPDGTRREFTDVTITEENSWRSTRTFNDHPTRWRLTVPDAELDLHVDGVFDDQEFITLISKPAFWEGCCSVTGARAGQPVSGRGFVERSGFATIDTLEEFFSAVGDKVRESVSIVMPREVTFERARDLIASEEREHYMDGVSLDALSDALAAPVREIADRGGKAWRSYAALACCDIVGGDSRQHIQWLAMPEFLHIGSLIVDDVEDRSEMRRGGPTCHLLYGEAITINAGSACYFLGHNLLKNEKLDDIDKLRVYDLYFEALRAGHAGQALDLHGLTEAFAEAAESGEGEALERSVIAIHRLKTAVPAASLARMGGVAGNGTEEQIEALGAYFESVGIAFQIMDDVLNLRGFKGKLKTRGEDIMRGLVTMPVAKAITRMSLEERRELSRVVSSEPQDEAVVAGVIDTLEACGAIDACTAQASGLVEEAWSRLDPVVEPSLPKVMLRAFGWFVLERHY